MTTWWTRSSTSWCATCHSTRSPSRSRASSTEKQIALCQQMLRKPQNDAERYDRVWESQVRVLDGAYEMQP